MDYFEAVERRLDLPPEEASQVIKELRSHYDELRGELLASGMSDSDAESEAQRRLGDPEQLAVQLRRAHSQSTWCGLFPPRDFIPTSVFWGLWAGGVLAGANYVRLGRRELGRKLILFSLFAQAGVWLALLYVGRFAAGGPLSIRPGLGMHLSTPWLAYALSLLIVNGSAGYLFFRAQNGLYSRWAAEHPPHGHESPYLAWWVSVLAILGALAVILVVGTVLIR